MSAAAHAKHTEFDKIATSRQPIPEARMTPASAKKHTLGATEQLSSVHMKAEQERTQQRIQRLEQLLTFESQVRAVKSLKELQFCAVNEALQLVSARQIFFVRRKFKSQNGLRICSVSNLSTLDSNAPAVVSLEKLFQTELLEALGREGDMRQTPHSFHMPAQDPPTQSDLEQPRRSENAVVVPLFDSHGIWLGCLVFQSEDGSVCQEIPIVARLAEIVQYAWQGFIPGRRIRTRFNWKQLGVALALCLILAGMFVRVPLTTLAPVEIVASDPVVVAAPIGGVIRQILVDANVEVKAGAHLFQYEDTVLLSELKIAEQAWSVANAKLKQAQLSSFGEGSGKRDLATAQAELDLALAEFEFAKAKFSQTIVKAPKQGVVVLDRKSDWQGKPVSVGQRVLEIAQVSDVEARIDLAVSDAIVLNKNAKAQLYLDSNPLNALDATVTSASYRASLDAANELSFAVSANIAGEGEVPPRIGSRGTAQIYGQEVSLGFYLFRRPFAAVRQWVGW